MGSVPKGGTDPKPCAISPMAGTGFAGYKNVCDVEVGQWAIDESLKIEDVARNALNDRLLSPSALIWRFTTTFNDCCTHHVKDLRAELLARLGPPAEQTDEIRSWKMLFLPLPQNSEGISPQVVVDYSPYLRRLGLDLKRRTVPRLPPLMLHYTEQTEVSNAPAQFPYHALFTIRPSRSLPVGYVVVEFNETPAGINASLNDGDSVKSHEPVANGDVSALLSSNSSFRSLIVRIGKTPLSSENPLLLDVEAHKEWRISKVRWFDE